MYQGTPKDLEVEEIESKELESSSSPAGEMDIPLSNSDEMLPNNSTPEPKSPDIRESDAMLETIKDAVEQAEEHITVVQEEKPKRQINDEYQEVVRRALGKAGHPLKAGNFVGRYIKFLRGQYLKGEKGVGQKTEGYQLSDQPASPEELIAFTLWYRKEYKQEKIPTTFDTLRQRIDEFRALPESDYCTRIEDGKTRLQRLMTGDESLNIVPTAAYIDNAAQLPGAGADVEYNWDNFEKAEEIIRKYAEKATI